MSLLTSLLFLILVARLCGQLFLKFNQSSIVGEILAGVLLGPSVLNLVSTNAGLSAISELATFLVVLSAGLEMDFKKIYKILCGRGIVIGILGFFLPFCAGGLVGYLFHLDVIPAIFLAICVSITALPVTVRILQSFKMLNTDIAHYAIATAIFNDVIALLLLGVLLALPANWTYTLIGSIILTVAVKFVIMVAFIFSINWVIQHMIEKKIRFEDYQKKIIYTLDKKTLFGALVLFALIFGSISEKLGFHFVIGTFFGALLIDKKLFLSSHYKDFERTLNSITEVFFAPVFFAFLGLQFNWNSMDSYGFVLVIILVAVVSKITAGYVGGRLIKLSKIKSLGIGFILNGRGVMELVIASIGYKLGLIDQGLFTTLVLMGVLTTVLTSFMFKQWIVPHIKPAKTSTVPH